VGIGNTNARRIEKHLSNGWHLHEVLLFKRGTIAHQVEQEVIEWFRVELNLGPAYRSGDGWTETVSAKEIDIKKVSRKVKSVSAGRATKVKVTNFKK